MHVGDLVRFTPEASITDALMARPVGIVVQVGVVHPNDWDTGLQMITARFVGIDTPFSLQAKDFEVVNEDW